MLHRQSLIRAVGLFATALLVASQAHPAHLVRDINTTPTNAHSTFQEQIVFGNVVLFTLDDGVHGMELWSTDGTPAGTRLVRDINPGPAASDVVQLTVLGSSAYFWANDGTNGMELWRTDGTTTGTVIVANIGPGAQSFGGPTTNGAPLTIHQGVFYFTADDGQSGLELWRSDGTRTGTFRVADIRAGAASSEPGDLKVIGAHVFFAADDGARGRELWRTDGTAGGTSLVVDILPGPRDGFGEASGLVANGDTFYFRASDGVHGMEPWIGTANGARMARDLNLAPDVFIPGNTEGSNPFNFLPISGGALFIAEPTQGSRKLYRFTGEVIAEVMDAPLLGMFEHFRIGDRIVFHFGNLMAEPFQELWVTDGTAAGTVPLRPGDVPLFLAPTTFDFEQTPTEVIFYAYSGAHGSPVNLWRTDGTSEGTSEYIALPQPMIAGDLAKIGDRFYFYADPDSDPAGRELWTTDGAPGSMQRVADINPGFASSQVGGLFPALGKLFFQAITPTMGIEPWVSDGTEAGTMALGDLNATVQSEGGFGSIETPFGNGILLVANDGFSGNELWFSDGSEAGTQQLADIAPGDESSNPAFFLPMQGFVLFMANDGSSGRELWRTDGTLSGTRRVADIAPGGADGDPLQSSFGGAVLNGVAYFAADDGTNGRELWRSDGTAAGTFMVVDLTIGNGSSQISGLVTVGSRVLFSHLSAGEVRLWSTNGTAAGTVPVREDFAMHSTSMALLNGLLYFNAREGDDPSRFGALWRTDGTTAGTQRVSDPAPDPGLNIDFMRTLDDAIVFRACRSGIGCELYGSDGTNAGTQVIFNSSLGAEPAFSDDGRMFFAPQFNTRQIFVTDGSVAGTVQFVPASVDFGGAVLTMTWFKERLLFTVMDPNRGPVIWLSDGTAAGTRRVLDIDPGVTMNPAVDYTVSTAGLFFGAGHETTGFELYIIEDERPFANNDSAAVTFNTTARIAVLDNDAPFIGAIDRSSLAITFAPQSGVATIDAATREIVYTPNTGFSGVDRIEYQVRDDQGRVSDPAAVFVIVGAAQGGGPGTGPPAPPPNNPGNPGGGNGGGGGGGGSSSWLVLVLIALARLRSFNAARDPTTRPMAGR